MFSADCCVAAARATSHWPGTGKDSPLPTPSCCRASRSITTGRSDVPFRRPIAHLALAGIPVEEVSFDEGALNKGAVPYGTGRGSFGREGYAGPRPIPGHGPHAYVFQLFALGSTLSLPTDASADAILQAMRGRVVGRGRLTGYYER
jgi:phosphatidylethanolamine-binding protein (PEBP) family uncharacterized protein